LIEEHPTVRACLLMADIEQAEHGSTGQVREWLARAARSPRDPVWIADGVVSDHWAPVSPVTGRLDAFVWQAPPDVLTGPGPLVDDVTADLDDRPRIPAAIAPPEPAAAMPADTVPPPSPPAADAKISEPSSTPPAVPEPVPAPAGPLPAEEPAAAAPEASPVLVEEVKSDAPSDQPRPNGKGPVPEPVVFPVSRPPDDPGPKEAKPSRLRLFG
jgi:HemY protein